MHNEKKYPFHGTGVQGLEETDPARRIRFCRFLLNADIDDAWLLKSILWTDESKFSREGITNFHNLHEWADKDSNPHWKKQLEEDTENFIQYQIMSKQQGVPVTLRLRKGVLPHKFQCQKENKPIPVRQAALKRQRLSLVQDTLSQAATREVITETKLCGGPADTTITFSQQKVKAFLVTKPYK
ncbi:hypothetical protein JTB14_035300 [Gonioctena quinquepunctata]|nr:hypothetical protein JTB14_035300 [Gonioctena quinquepunctata]